MWFRVVLLILILVEFESVVYDFCDNLMNGFGLVLLLLMGVVGVKFIGCF